jgi:hypothetical protein
MEDDASMFGLVLLNITVHGLSSSLLWPLTSAWIRASPGCHAGLHLCPHPLTPEFRSHRRLPSASVRDRGLRSRAVVAKASTWSVRRRARCVRRRSCKNVAPISYGLDSILIDASAYGMGIYALRARSPPSP